MELNNFPHDGDDETKQRWFKAKTGEIWCLKKLTRGSEESAEYWRKENEWVQMYQKKVRMEKAKAAEAKEEKAKDLSRKRWVL